ncbi:hypothetical protein QTP86_012717 [Hemibagrus guttatus]|nr:hypothetical protein QTP86_012717 [Hemibagrus guttatus]
MDEYIEEALAAGFFFVEKKDSGLQPCIDYRGLNMIKVRYPCPLPLVLTALEQLQEARIFTKLDLRSAYNLISIPMSDSSAQALDYYTQLKNVKFFDILKPFVMKCLFTIYGRSLQCQYTMRKKG